MKKQVSNPEQIEQLKKDIRREIIVTKWVKSLIREETILSKRR
jgi:hypothetical protein